jgi:hypothetical protein
MNVSTLTAATFSLIRTQGGEAVEGAVTCANNVATFTPSNGLAYSTSYTAALTSGVDGIKDLAGNPLAADYTWSFTTVTPSGTAVSLSASPGTVTWNETCEVSVNIADVTDFKAFQFNIQYDPGVLQVTGAEGGTQGVTQGLIGSIPVPVDNWAFFPSGKEGTISVAGNITAAQSVSGSGCIAKIHFKVISDQGLTTSLIFTNTSNLINKLFNYYGNPMPAESITWTNTEIVIIATKA